MSFLVNICFLLVAKIGAVAFDTNTIDKWIERQRMDADFFLRNRIKFIKFYYEEASGAFRNLKNKIEKGDPPFDKPPYSEDPEPAFLDEWMDADTAQNVLRQTCIGLISDSIKLYLNGIKDHLLCFEWTQQGLKDINKRGFVPVYMDLIKKIINDNEEEGVPVDFALLEQIVLARNRSQHATDISTFRLTYDLATLKKYQTPFFIDQEDYGRWKNLGGQDSVLWFTPDLEITKKHLFAAMDEVLKLADWVNNHGDKMLEWRRKLRGMSI